MRKVWGEESVSAQGMVQKVESRENLNFSAFRLFPRRTLICNSSDNHCWICISVQIERTVKDSLHCAQLNGWTHGNKKDLQGLTSLLFSHPPLFEEDYGARTSNGVHWGPRHIRPAVSRRTPLSFCGQPTPIVITVCSAQMEEVGALSAAAQLIGHVKLTVLWPGHSAIFCSFSLCVLCGSSYQLQNV